MKRTSQRGRKEEEYNLKFKTESIILDLKWKFKSEDTSLISDVSINQITNILYEGGMSEDKILHVLSKDATAHGMQQLFSQIKADMTNTTEEKEPDKDEQAENNNSEAEENSYAESGKAEVSNTDSNNKTAKTDSISCSPEDIAKAMEPMFMKLTEGLTEVLKPDDNRFSAEIDRLERQVKELRSDLASSVGVIKSKESEIGRLREEMAKMKAGHEDSNAAPLVREPKPTADINLKSAKDIKNTPEDSSNIVNNQSTKKAEIFGNYRTVLKTADGREIPVQIEKSEARRPGGMMAMAARLFGGTPSQKALLNMLIDKRLTPEQLKQIKRAKDQCH